MLRKYCCIACLLPLFMVNNAMAQDPQFSQYYAAPMYLNPAMTGITQLGRAGLNYRNQWPSIDANFETFSFYIDNNFDEKNSSLGFMVLNDKQGIAGLQSTEVSLLYAYQVQVNYKWVFRPAFQVSFTDRDLNLNNLVFGDQLDANGITGNPTGENFNNFKVNYFDLALGGIVYSKNSWIGVSMNHVREPNQSFVGGETKLPRKLSVHGGFRIPLQTGYKKGETQSGAKREITPSFNYRSQGEFDQLDLGVYFTWEPVIFGLWYRGLPIKSTATGGSNSEALIFMAGFTKNKMTFGYSFDYTLSNLGISSGGAHEISLIYSFKVGGKNKPARNVRQLECPLPMIF